MTLLNDPAGASSAASRQPDTGHPCVIYRKIVPCQLDVEVFHSTSKIIYRLPSSIPLFLSPIDVLTMRLPSLLTLLFLLVPAIRAAVLAIDYGAEFTKLSLIKPGVPFDVVLDRDSKRKIQSVVGWKREDRVFGQEGKMAVSYNCTYMIWCKLIQ
jgi:hypothetical protein